MWRLQLATCNALVVLVPSYTATYFTGEMVWVVPTLVTSGFFAVTMDIRHRVDEDGGHGHEDDPHEDGFDRTNSYDFTFVKMRSHWLITVRASDTFKDISIP